VIHSVISNIGGNLTIKDTVLEVVRPIMYVIPFAIIVEKMKIEMTRQLNMSCFTHFILVNHN